MKIIVKKGNNEKKVIKNRNERKTSNKIEINWCFSLHDFKSNQTNERISLLKAALNDIGLVGVELHSRFYEWECEFRYEHYKYICLY